MDLIIYTAANDKSQAAVTSLTDTTPVDNLEDLVLGDSAPLTVKFTDGSAAPSWAGDPTYTLTVGLGTLDANGGADYTDTTAFTGITSGWSGRLPLTTQFLIDALALQVGSAVDWTRFPTTLRTPYPRPYGGYFALQISVTDPSGYKVTYAVLRVFLRSRVLPQNVSATSAPSTFYAVQNRYAVTGLVNFAAIATASGAQAAGGCVVLDLSVTVTDGAGTHAGILTLLYQLVATTQASNSPLWIRPNDYNGISNAVAWRLLGSFLDTLPASYNADTGRFHYMGVAGAAGACYSYVDQTGVSAP